MINLAENKNPFYPSPAIKKKAQEVLDNISNYPDYKNVDINRSIAAFFNVPEENAIITNGSMEGMNLLVDILDTNSTTIYTPTFWGYSDAFIRREKKYNKVALKNGMQYDFEQISSDAQKSSLIFLCNPNNPTLSSLDKEDIQKLLLSNPNCNFIVDETMLIFDPEYDKKTISTLVSKCNNLSVICSFSKIFGLAGIRSGALLSNCEVIKAAKQRQIPYGIDTIKQLIIPTALKDKEYLQLSRVAIKQNSRILCDKIESTTGFTTVNSGTNFVLVQANNGFTSTEIDAYLKTKGILIRNAKEAYPDMPGEYIRVSIGTKEENEQLINELDNLVNKRREKREFFER